MSTSKSLLLALFHRARMWLAVVYILFPLALGALVNVTIDDTYGDPNTGAQFVYSPPGSWNVGQSCAACTAHPDPQLLYDHTWHDGTFNPVPGSNSNPNEPIYATIQFSGTAVYVQCVIADSFSGPDGNSDMVFYIDNDVVGSYVRTPLGTGTYYYDVTVYANTSIPAGQHTLVVQTGHVNGNKSLLLIDTVIYSTDSSTPPPSGPGPSSHLQSVPPLQTATLSNSSSTSTTTPVALSNSTATHVGLSNSTATPVVSSKSSTSTATPVAQVSSTHPTSTRVTVLAAVCAASGVALISIFFFLLWCCRHRFGSARLHPTPFTVNGDVGASPSAGSTTAYNSVPMMSTPQLGGEEKRFAESESAYMADKTDVSPGVPSSSNVPSSSEAGYSGGGVLEIGSDTMSQVPDDAPPAYDPSQRPPTIIRGSARND